MRAEKMFGYMGKILRINLTKERIVEEPLEEGIARKFIGGRGLGAYILFNELNPGIDPLGPENKLVVATGVVTGIPFPGNSGFNVMAKSPLTGTIHDSQSGGDFGPYLKFSGVDGVIFEGSSEKPVYLWIENGSAELRDASRLWGKDVFTTTDAIVKKSKKVRVACIGPAGERLVRFANIMNEKHRAAGRGGHGAVLGSKRVKAIAVKGNTRPPIADETGLRKVNRRVAKKIKEMSSTGDSLPKHGTAVLVDNINEEGGLPTRNFQTGVFATADRISGETLTDTFSLERWVVGAA